MPAACMPNSAPEMGIPSRLVFVALAGAWFALGATSTQTPMLSGGMWIVSLTVPSGAALAVARHQTMFALRVYLCSVAAAAALRSVAFVIDRGAWNVACVWLIVLCSSMVAHASISRDGRRW